MLWWQWRATGYSDHRVVTVLFIGKFETVYVHNIHIQLYNFVICVVYFCQNYFILSSSMDKTVRLWHISRRECLCCFQHIDFVTAIAFHPKVVSATYHRPHTAVLLCHSLSYCNNKKRVFFYVPQCSAVKAGGKYNYSLKTLVIHLQLWYPLDIHRKKFLECSTCINWVKFLFKLEKCRLFFLIISGCDSGLHGKLALKWWVYLQDIYP